MLQCRRGRPSSCQVKYSCCQVIYSCCQVKYHCCQVKYSCCQAKYSCCQVKYSCPTGAAAVLKVSQIRSKVMRLEDSYFIVRRRDTWLMNPPRRSFRSLPAAWLTGLLPHPVSLLRTWQSHVVMRESTERHRCAAWLSSLLSSPKALNHVSVSRALNLVSQFAASPFPFSSPSPIPWFRRCLGVREALLPQGHAHHGARGRIGFWAFPAGITGE